MGLILHKFIVLVFLFSSLSFAAGPKPPSDPGDSAPPKSQDSDPSLTPVLGSDPSVPLNNDLARHMDSLRHETVNFAVPKLVGLVVDAFRVAQKYAPHGKKTFIDADGKLVIPEELETARNNALLVLRAITSITPTFQFVPAENKFESVVAPAILSICTELLAANHHVLGHTTTPESLTMSLQHLGVFAGGFRVAAAGIDYARGLRKSLKTERLFYRTLNAYREEFGFIMPRFYRNRWLQAEIEKRFHFLD